MELTKFAKVFRNINFNDYKYVMNFCNKHWKFFIQHKETILSKLSQNPEFEIYIKKKLHQSIKYHDKIRIQKYKNWTIIDNKKQSSKLCIKCKFIYASYNFKGNKAKYCNSCKIIGMVYIR
jgi:hypothetical protein